MNFHNPYEHLTNRQRNLCEYGGTFGVLLTLTCLIQHLVAVIPTGITNSMVIGYVYILIAFILLGLQKHYSVLLVIIGAAVSLLMEILWVLHASFSLAVVLLFIYHVIMIIALYTEGVPPRLQQKRDAKRKEEDSWAGKI